MKKIKVIEINYEQWCKRAAQWKYMSQRGLLSKLSNESLRLGCCIEEVGGIAYRYVG